MTSADRDTGFHHCLTVILSYVNLFILESYFNRWLYLFVSGCCSMWILRATQWPNCWQESYWTGCRHWTSRDCGMLAWWVFVMILMGKQSMIHLACGKSRKQILDISAVNWLCQFLHIRYIWWQEICECLQPKNDCTSVVSDQRSSVHLQSLFTWTNFHADFWWSLYT